MHKIATRRLSMKEAAQHLGRSYSWLFSNHRVLGLNGYRIGGRWFFDLQELVDWEQNLRDQNRYMGQPNTSSKTRKQSVSFI